MENWEIIATSLHLDGIYHSDYVTHYRKSAIKNLESYTNMQTGINELYTWYYVLCKYRFKLFWNIIISLPPKNTSRNILYLQNFPKTFVPAPSRKKSSQSLLWLNGSTPLVHMRQCLWLISLLNRSYTVEADITALYMRSIYWPLVLDSTTVRTCLP